MYFVLREPFRPFTHPTWLQVSCQTLPPFTFLLPFIPTSYFSFFIKKNKYPSPPEPFIYPFIFLSPFHLFLKSLHFSYTSPSSLSFFNFIPSPFHLLLYTLHPSAPPWFLLSQCYLAFSPDYYGRSFSPPPFPPSFGLRGSPTCN